MMSVEVCIHGQTTAPGFAAGLVTAEPSLHPSTAVSPSLLVPKVMVVGELLLSANPDEELGVSSPLLLTIP